MADKILTELIINRGTKQKYDDLPVKSPDELYFLTDADTYQEKLIPGENITIDANNVISSTGAKWGNITGDLSDQEDLGDVLDTINNRIDNVEARGRFLALWNATTGLPESNPGESPYTYKAGDYYIVGVVGATNYKPSGTQFVVGQPSTEVETEELATDDVYYFDGAVWHLQVNHGKTVSFANLAGQPEDNTALKDALDGKVGFADYASTTSAGVIIVNPNLGTSITSGGSLISPPKDAAAYAVANQSMFISKGTLENIKEDLVTSIGDTKYQSTLISGANIKTINNESLLGSGNIDITSAQWGNITGTLSNQTDLQEALDDKTTVIIRRW